MLHSYCKATVTRTPTLIHSNNELWQLFDFVKELCESEIELHAGLGRFLSSLKNPLPTSAYICLGDDAVFNLLLRYVQATHVLHTGGLGAARSGGRVLTSPAHHLLSGVLSALGLWVCYCSFLFCCWGAP